MNRQDKQELVDSVQFIGWPKISRLNRGIVITEKIDGTNAAIGVTTDGRVYAQSRTRVITPQSDNMGFARWVEQHADALREHLGVGLHFGEWWGVGIQRGYDLSERRFSLFNAKRWAHSTEGLLALAALREKGAAVYTVPVLYEGPWVGVFGFIDGPKSEEQGGPVWLAAPQGWPELDGLFAAREQAVGDALVRLGNSIDSTAQELVADELRRVIQVNPRPRYAPNFILEWLKRIGSQAAPGYMRPEGIIVYFPAGDTLFKATVEKDEEHKGEQRV